MDPERAHYRTMALFGWGLKMPFLSMAALSAGPWHAGGPALGCG